MSSKPLIELWISGIPRTQGSGDRMLRSRKVTCRACGCTSTIQRATVGPYVDSSDKQLRDQHGNVTRKSGALKRWKENVRTSAKVAMWEGDHELIEDAPVSISFLFVLERPKSVKRALPHKALDLSKMVRAVEDALEGVAYGNDAQICDFGRTRKIYATKGETPGVHIAWQEVSDVASNPALALDLK